MLLLKGVVSNGTHGHVRSRLGACVRRAALRTARSTWEQLHKNQPRYEEQEETRRRGFVLHFGLSYLLPVPSTHNFNHQSFASVCNCRIFGEGSHSSSSSPSPQHNTSITNTNREDLDRGNRDALSNAVLLLVADGVDTAASTPSSAAPC